MMKKRLRQWLGGVLAILAPLVAGADESCYAGLPSPPVERISRALYLMVDQTTPLDDDFKARIRSLVGDWGMAGDHVGLARFSANIRGHYPELSFEGSVEASPGEAYLFQLRSSDKRRLLRCLEERGKAVREGFRKHLDEVLAGVNYKIPKTDLFYSLKLLSDEMIRSDDAPRRIVLVVTDGLENSAITSFYHRGRIRTIDPRKELSKVRRAGLLANWKGARIYVYGLGLTPDRKRYLDPRRILRLKEFWERYFVAGNGDVAALGTPEFFRRRLE